VVKEDVERGEGKGYGSRRLFGGGAGSSAIFVPGRIVHVQELCEMWLCGLEFLRGRLTTETQRARRFQKARGDEGASVELQRGIHLATIPPLCGRLTERE